MEPYFGAGAAGGDSSEQLGASKMLQQSCRPVLATSQNSAKALRRRGTAQDLQALRGAAKDAAQAPVTSPCSPMELARPWPPPPLRLEQRGVEPLLLRSPFP